MGRADLNRQLDLASAEIRRLSEHRSHWMQPTELEEEARRREAHGRRRLEAEAGQLRKELAKARRCAAALQEQLQAPQSKFEERGSGGAPVCRDGIWRVVQAETRV